MRTAKKLVKYFSLFPLFLAVSKNNVKAQCTPANIIGTTSINTPGYPLSSSFNTSTTLPGVISNLGNGLINFTGTVSGTARWVNGIRLENDAISGDYIYVQPNNTQNTTTANIARYTLDLAEPLYNFSFRTAGMNNQDQIRMTAFYKGVPITISAANISDIVDDPGNGGTITISGNTLTGNNTAGGTSVNTNRFTTTIAGPVDSIVMTSGKGNNSNSTVTLGFTTFSYTRCVTVPPDVNATFVNVAVTGNVGTNDIKPGGTTYGNAAALPGNPNAALPSVNTDGTYSFTSAVPGKYQFYVPMCPPGVTGVGCPDVLLTITVIDPTAANNIPFANIDRATTPVNTAVTLNTLANDFSGNSGINLNPASVTVTSSPVNGIAAVNPATGEITYTPNPGFTGYDTLTYQVCDLSASTPNCVTSLQIITIQDGAIANNTSAADDYKTTPLNTPVSSSVLTNDNDPQGNNQTTTAQNTSIGGIGTLVLNTNGTYTFTPVSGYSGPVNYPYEVCDNGTPSACTNATLYILITPGATLPVTLKNFTAITENKNSKLLWQTENQVNFSHFEVQRSFTGRDDFETIGIVNATSTNDNYSYADNNVGTLKQTVYYRLKMVDIDDKFKISRIALVNFGKDVFVDVRPTLIKRGELLIVNIAGSNNEKYDLSVIDLSGKILQKSRINSDISYLPVTSLNSGVYIIRVSAKDKHWSYRVVVQ